MTSMGWALVGARRICASTQSNACELAQVSSVPARNRRLTAICVCLSPHFFLGELLL